MNPWLEVLILFLLILANGYLSMSEISLISAKKIRLQQQAEDGDKRAKTAVKLIEHPNILLSTVQVGITLVGTLAGAFGGATLANRLAIVFRGIPWLAPYSSVAAFLVVVLLTTYFTLVIGELIPKRIGLNNPEKTAKEVSGVMKTLSILAAPIVRLLSASTEFGLKLIGAKKSEEPPITEDEIKVLMEQGTQAGMFQEAEQDMIEDIFRLSDRTIDSVMTPRTDLEWIDLTEPIEMIREQVIQSSHSRFPAAKGKLDNAQGILHAREFFEKLLEGKPFSVEKLLRPALYVPESTSVFDTLGKIKQASVHEALVLDEYGGLLGFVTLYDMLKAIVGEIPGLDDDDEPSAVRREDGSWLLDGLLDIDDLKDIIDVDSLPDEMRVGFQTLGGFVMSQMGDIPRKGQVFYWNNLKFEVMDMDGNRIDQVLVSLLPPPEAEESK
ncbi:MAG TPA: hemolysin family protein [Bellilinea sp.]|nr:hemolysin family protein [Bellilinea sp.]